MGSGAGDFPSTEGGATAEDGTGVSGVPRPAWDRITVLLK